MKKLYKVFLDSDLGELWLDENKNLLAHIHCNDGDFRDEYHGFIIDYLGGELINIDIHDLGLTQEEMDERQNCYSGEDFFDLIKDKLPK